MPEALFGSNQKRGTQVVSRMFQGVRIAALAGVVVVGGGSIHVASATAATVTSAASSVSPSAGSSLASRLAAGTDAQINQTLDEVARTLASAVTSAPLRQTLHDEVAKRFDGDEEALWSTLADEPAFARPVARATARGKTSYRQAREQVTDLGSDLPQMQVAIPVHFNEWDPATEQPLVAYFPQGVDDLSVKTITAYDASGRSVQLDAQTAPTQPVIVVGLNERTDAIGQLAKGHNKPARGTAPTTARRAINPVDVHMEAAQILDDHEPWALGDAEISLAAKSMGCGSVDFLEPNYPGLNNDGDAVVPHTYLGSTKCQVGLAWWEDDGGAWNFELSVAGTGFGIGMDNDDDEIGKLARSYSDWVGASWDHYQWAGLAQQTS